MQLNNRGQHKDEQWDSFAKKIAKIVEEQVWRVEQRAQILEVVKQICQIEDRGTEIEAKLINWIKPCILQKIVIEKHNNNKEVITHLLKIISR